MKAATTYLDNGTMPRRRSRVRVSNTRNEAIPQWFVVTVVALMASLLCVAINIRAYSESRDEVQLNTQLSSEIEQLSAGNALLQHEIQGLKTDENTIEREARKLGFVRPNEKIFVPTN
jgi:cell division protein FtsB